MPNRNYAQTQQRLQELAESDNKNARKIAEKHYKAGVSDTPIAQMNEFLAEASQDEQFVKEFNEVLGLTSNKITSFSEDDVKAQVKLLHPSYTAEQVDEAVKKFATTGSDTSGDNVAIDPILPSNILEVDEYLFAEDGGIISQVTRETYDGETQMPEFDVFPLPQNGAELTDLVEKEFNRRDGEDYVLNPNKKFGILTKVSDLGLRKGSAAYFGTLRRGMVRGVENELVYQMYQGTDAGNQMHGMLKAVTPANAANKRGSFDVTADTKIAAEDNNFRKLVLMLGTLPSDLKDSEFATYSWDMSRNTWFADIVPSLDGNGRYYLDAIMSGTPVLVGPGGLRINFVSERAVPRGTVQLNIKKKYILAMPGNIELKDDMGISNFASGQTLIKATAMADGGYVHNFMRTSGHNGTDPDDNRDRNFFRHITGLNA